VRAVRLLEIRASKRQAVGARGDPLAIEMDELEEPLAVEDVVVELEDAVFLMRLDVDAHRPQEIAPLDGGELRAGRRRTQGQRKREKQPSHPRGL